jgi:hypothetical protein
MRSGGRRATHAAAPGRALASSRGLVRAARSCSLLAPVRLRLAQEQTVAFRELRQL